MPRVDKLSAKPDYSSSKSLNEEPLQVQKDLNFPQRSGSIFSIQKKVLKEIGVSDTQINSTDTDDADDHAMD